MITLKQALQEAADNQFANEANTFFNNLINLLKEVKNIRIFNLKTNGVVLPCPFISGKQLNSRYQDLIIVFTAKKVDEPYKLVDKEQPTKFQPAINKYRMVLKLFQQENFKNLNFKDILVLNKKEVVEQLIVPYLTIKKEFGNAATSKREQAIAFNDLITKVIYFLNHHHPIEKISKKNFHKYFAYVKKILKERKPNYNKELGKLDKEYQKKAVGKLYKNWLTIVVKKKIK